MYIYIYIRCIINRFNRYYCDDMTKNMIQASPKIGGIILKWPLQNRGTG
jgi:hypothetical protein